MNTRRVNQGRRRVGRRLGYTLESLESRSLLTATSETFTGPSLTSLIVEAKHGRDVVPAVATKLVNALESQLQSGPLADLNLGSVNSNGFIIEAQGLETSFEQDLVQQKLAGQFSQADIDQLLRLQGQNVVAGLIAENQESAVGLIAVSNLPSTFQSTIQSLTTGPIHAIGTSSSVPVSLTKGFRNELNLLSNDLANSSLTIEQAKNTLGAEAEAYRAEIHAALQVADPTVSGHTDTRINELENAVAQADSTDVTSAIKTFISSVLDTTGLFGTNGLFSKTPKNVTQHPLVSLGQTPSLITGVSGTTTNDGTATLTATLSSFNGSPIMGQTVAFTLDGAFAGVALTNFIGVATLSEVSTTDAVGTDTSGIHASFASNTNFLSSDSTGNLTVNQVGTTVSGVSGTGAFGGTDTLTATLTNLATNQPFVGQSVTFLIDGGKVGTATTNASGVATLSGVTSTDSAGTDSGGVVASYAGTNVFAGSTSAGNLVVAQAGTTLTEVAGAARIGGTANLTATLTSNVTNLPIANETISFTLDGTSVGTATTNSSGVATLTGVTTTDGIGTDTGGVVASFAGDSNHSASSNVTGNLVVSQNTTNLQSIGGTVMLGGTASLTATLINSTTGVDLSGKTINFTLDGKSVGTAVTSNSGVATLAGIATTQPVGTDTNGVVASFTGDTNDSSSIGTGNLVVSAAGSSLSNVGGTAGVGGTATLTATLLAGNTGNAISGQTVTFNLDGTSVGTAVTNASGIATLTGVATTHAAGTDTGGVVATFAGSTNYTSSTTTGNLVVSTNPATLGSVSGTASFGGTAILTATFTDATTHLGIAGRTITFKLDGISVGTAVTNSSGVATLAAVATTHAVGTDSGGIVASFAGDTTYVSASGTGNLVVSKANTALATVGGSAISGGTATLKATLTSTVTGLALSGQTVSFKLDGTAAGTAVTDGTGVATLSGVATTDALGTDTGGVVASYAGDTDYNLSTGTGDLIVSPGT